MSLKLSDFLNALTFKKEDLTDHPDFEKDYNPYIINRFLSMGAGSAHIAHFASKLSGMSKKSHYLFLLNILDKKKTYLTYAKKEKGGTNDADLDVIKEYYRVGEQQAIEIVSLLNEEQIKKIKRSFGGRKKI